MANENTAAGNLANWQMAAAVLQESFFESYKPMLRFFSHIHHDSQSVARNNVKRYRVKSDPGTAASGPGESVALTNTYQVTAGTNIDVTSTEFVADLAEFSFESIANTHGLDLEMVANTMTNGTSDQIKALLATYVGDLIYRALRSAEATSLALLSGLGTSVGSTGSDFTIARMLAARYQFRINQPHRSIADAEYWMPEIGISDVETEALSTSGGVGGNLWGGSADYGIANNPGNEFMLNGLLGTFLKHRVYTIPPDLNVAAGATGVEDVLGGFGVPGVSGVAPDAPQIAGQPGAFSFYERMPLRVDCAPSFTGRGGLIRTGWHGGFVETSDKDMVKLIVDAP